MMKKILLPMLVFALVFLTHGTPAAAAGGDRSGDGPLCSVVEVFTGLEGTVEDCLESGGGLVLLTADGEVIVYGIGPTWYWESLGVERPAVGDTIVVSGYIVDCGGVVRYILTSVDVSGEGGETVTVALRDPETGLPAWRSQGRTGDGSYGPGYGRDDENGGYGPAYGMNDESTGPYGACYGAGGGR
jgi:hypothetical protein